MSGPAGTITLSINDYLTDKTRMTAAENEIADLKKQIGAARLEDPSGKVPSLVATVRAVMAMAQFAVANLPPETKGWPIEAVRALAAGIDALPDVTQAEREMAIDLHAFARECDEVVAARALRVAAQRREDAAASIRNFQLSEAGKRQTADVQADIAERALDYSEIELPSNS